MIPYGDNGNTLRTSFAIPPLLFSSRNEAVSPSRLFAQALLLLLRCQKRQAPLFPFRHAGRSMKPLLFRYRLQLDGIRRAFNHTHAAADTLGPFHLRLAGIQFHGRTERPCGQALRALDDGVHRATLDAQAAGDAFFRINDSAVV